MPDDDKNKPKTFTQADIDKIVEDRLKKERDKYADYDELKAKAAKADEAEARTKSAEQKLDERIKAAEDKAADAEKRVAAAEANALRLSVASEKKLTSAQAKRLVGTTREELEADADDLLESFPSSTSDEGGNTKTKPKDRPRERLAGGGAPTEETVEMDPAKLAESVPRL